MELEFEGAVYVSHRGLENPQSSAKTSAIEQRALRVHYPWEAAKSPSFEKSWSNTRNERIKTQCCTIVPPTPMSQRTGPKLYAFPPLTDLSSRIPVLSPPTTAMKRFKFISRGFWECRFGSLRKLSVVSAIVYVVSGISQALS